MPAASSLPYKVIKPATHSEWLAERTKGIGASDAGKVIGVSNYGTPYTLWRAKVGLDAPVEETWFMTRGHIYEPYIAQLFQQETGLQVIKASAGDWLAVDKKKSWLRVSPDWTYWLEGKKHNPFNRGILEVKTFNSLIDINIDNWRDRHLDYFCQVQYQLHVLGLKQAFIGFLNVDNGEHFFDPIEYNADFCLNTLIPAIDELWLSHIKPAIALANTCPNNAQYIDEQLHEFAPAITNAAETLTRYPRQQEGKATDVPTPDFFDALTAYRNRKRQIKELDDENKAFEDTVKLYMQDAEFIPSADGKPIVTWKANRPSQKFDEKRFASDCPDLYEQYLTERQGARVLKIK